MYGRKWHGIYGSLHVFASKQSMYFISTINIELLVCIMEEYVVYSRTLATYYEIAHY